MENNNKPLTAWTDTELKDTIWAMQTVLDTRGKTQEITPFIKERTEAQIKACADELLRRHNNDSLNQLSLFNEAVKQNFG